MEGICVRCKASKLQALICELRGPFCCKPSSIVETPKTARRSSINVQIDVVHVNRLVVVSDSVPSRLDHKTFLSVRAVD